MFVSNVTMIKETEFSLEGARRVKIQKLIDETLAKNFMMRRFIIEKNGYTPLHKHNYEHEVFVLSGRGTVRSDVEEYQISKNSFVFLAPNESHQFLNKGKESLILLCMIPKIN